MRKSVATLQREKRNRILAATGAIMGAVLVAAGALLIWHFSQEADDLTDPEHTQESVVEESTEATTTTQAKPSASLADPDMTATSRSQDADPASTSPADSTSTSATSETTTATTAEQTTTTKAESSDDKLSGIAELKAGTVISSEKIDKNDLGRYFTSHEIEKGDAVYERINGKSYKKNDNISLSSLRYLKMLHVNFNGEYQVGEMIVNKKVAGDVLEIFQNLCENKYQIYSMKLIDDFWAGTGSKSDYASIDANNTSAFCYRTATGGGNLSKHALGLAIDLNPQQNPYVTYKNGKPKYSHENAKDYVENRSSDTPHVITKKDRAYKLFKNYGWSWGGSWSSPKDYQHFQLG